MSRQTANLNLTVWNLQSDTFDPSALASNWDKIDAQFSASAVSTTPIRYVESVSSLTASGTNGRLAYLTANSGGFVANTLMRYDTSSWKPIGPQEIVAALPTSGNYAGRMVVLSSAVSGFAQWDVAINTDGVNTWAKVGGASTSATVAGFTNNFAGKLGVLTSADSGFLAYSLLLYNGSSWNLVGPQAIPPATEVAYSPLTTDTTGTATSDFGTTLVTLSGVVTENVKYYLQVEIPRLKHSVASANISFRLREGGSNVGNPLQVQMTATGGNTSAINALIPFTPSAGAHTYTVTWWSDQSGTATINTTSLAPAVLRIIKA